MPNGCAFAWILVRSVSVHSSESVHTALYHHLCPLERLQPLMTLTIAQLIVLVVGLLVIGTGIGRYLKTGNAFQAASPNAALDKTMRQVFVLSLLIYVGIFVTDWFFTREKDILNDTIVGVLIGAPIGWYGAVIAFQTTEAEKKPTEDPP